MHYIVYINPPANIGRNAGIGQLGQSLRRVVFTFDVDLPQGTPEEYLTKVFTGNGWQINNISIVEGFFSDTLKIDAMVGSQYTTQQIEDSAALVLTGNGYSIPHRFTLISNSASSSVSPTQHGTAATPATQAGWISPTQHGSNTQSSGSAANQVRTITPANPTGAQTTIDKYIAGLNKNISDLFGSAENTIASNLPSTNTFLGALGISTPFAVIGGGLLLFLLLRR